MTFRIGILSIGKKNSRNLITGFLLLDLLLFLFWFANLTKSTPPQNYTEVQELASQNLDFQGLKVYFTKLAKNKGAEYAFNVLKVAPIQPGIDMHLLGHVVGDILYQQKGASGIKICTQDFRNACSHTIVVGLFSDKGVAALPEIAKACEEAPGGKGAYTMCFHGLGHGVLAFTGYDLPKTIQLCEKTATEKHNRREYVECVGGAIMEIISGGGHDPELWAKQSAKYLGTADPLYPCDADFMPLEVRRQCYGYLTPHLFSFAGGDRGNPTPSDFEKAFTCCNQLSASKEPANREACYGGFGKEFVVLARNRDIRDISNIKKDEIQKVIDWCSLADDPDGKKACLWSGVTNLYWGGENDVAPALAFCSQVNADLKDECHALLIDMVAYYKGEGEMQKVCSQISSDKPKNCN